MQIVKDQVENASSLLEELMSMMALAGRVDEATMPLAELMRRSPVKKSPPVLIAEVGKALKDCDVEDFEVMYPSISTAIKNGKLDVNGRRIYDAVLKMGDALIEIRKSKYMVAKDDQRQYLNSMAKDALADLAIYIICTYRLFDSSTCTMAVNQYCERAQYSPDVLYGTVLGVLQGTGRSYYSYEVMSPLYSELMANDAAFMAECEDKDLPLKDEQVERILRGEATTTEIMDELLKQDNELVHEECAISTFELMSRMNLDG